MKDNKFTTKAIREGYQPTQEQEHSAAIFLTSSFRFDSAEQAAKRFDNKDQGNVYSRFTNPSVVAFEEKLAALEGAEQCLATASGMSAIFATISVDAKVRAGGDITIFGKPKQIKKKIIAGGTIEQAK